MSARRMCIAALTIPVITLSLGCMSGHPIPLATTPLPSDRMMAIGQKFERQGRFAEARYVYQQVLEQDPVSPAAERLLAVVAAADVTNAQNLPVERLMSVGEFYESHGDVTLAHGIYKQILHRQPDFEPARKRIKALAADEEQLAGRTDHRPRKSETREFTPAVAMALRSTPNRKTDTSPNSASRNQLYPVPIFGQSAAVSGDREEQTVSPASGSVALESVESPGNRSSASAKPDQWRPRHKLPTSDSDSTSTPENSSAEVLELPGIVVRPAPKSQSSVQQTSAVNDAELDGEPPIPPAPAADPQEIPQSSLSSPPPSLSPSPLGPNKTPEPSVEKRIADLWRDKPLDELKASIEREQLHDTEHERLSLAKPHMVARGSMVQRVGQSRPWMLVGYEWEAPATRHLPLLFEEPNLERMGYSCGLGFNLCGYETGPCLTYCVQPIVSGSYFFGRVPFIPYMCGIDPPLQPIYTLGVDRPGSPVPYRRHLIPVTLKAMLYQAGAMTGVAYIPW